MSFISLAAIYQQLPQFYLTGTCTFSNPLLESQEALRELLFDLDFEADILNLSSNHLCLKRNIITHIEQHGHRKTSVPLSNKPVDVRDLPLSKSG